MKKVFKSLLWLVTVLMAYETKAQLAGFSYIEGVTVNNTASVNAVNYQLRLVLNTQAIISNSMMASNGDDIRFGKVCDGSTLYNYWIESGINTPTTVIWVKIDTIYANSSRTFFLFSGNASASSLSSVPNVFESAGSATDSVSTGTAGGATLSQRGFRFAPNVDILVTSFGKREPNGTLRYVTLFDQATGTVVAQHQVGGPSGSYTYSDLPAPLWLTQNTQYQIQLFQGSSDGYYYGTSSQIDSRLTYLDMRYCNSCTENTFPTSILTNYHYGYPDFLFYYRNTVNPAPTYTIGTPILPSFTVSGNSIMCSGQTVTLTATGATTYSWSNSSTSSSIVVSPTVNTTYTVIGTNSVGCSTQSAKEVTVNPLPSVSVSATSSTLCAGGLTVQLTGSPSGGVYSGSNVNGDVFTSGSMGGTFTAVYHYTNTSTGCSSSASTQIVVSVCTDVENHSYLASIVNVFPNPSNGIVQVSFNRSGIYMVELTDVNGKVIQSIKTDGKKQQFDITQNPSGVYFINVSSENDKAVFKVVKN
jgi:hypothetical protein